MKCQNPQLVWTNEKGIRVFRNFSALKDFQLKYYKVLSGCRKCLICRKKQALELAQRCELHASLYKQNSFITFTYDEKKEGYHNNFNYSDIQKFKKRLRAHCMRRYGRKIEIFNVHEYGKRGKKHWHLVVFNYEPSDKVLYTKKNNISIYTSKELERLWPYGFNTVGDVTTASAMYQAQYMEKDFKNGYVTSNKKSHSKHSGIGRPYFERHYEQILRLNYIPINGSKMPIPRYFYRLAKRHWAHFYSPDLFESFQHRKATFRPFTNEKPNKQIADLYVQYESYRQATILDQEKEWDDVILQYLTTKRTPDFILSAQNKLYDLKNKISKGNF